MLQRCGTLHSTQLHCLPPCLAPSRSTVARIHLELSLVAPELLLELLLVGRRVPLDQVLKLRQLHLRSTDKYGAYESVMGPLITA